jgi:hypothetical protein
VPRINLLIFTPVSIYWRIAKLFPQTLKSAMRSPASPLLAKSAVIAARLDQLSRPYSVDRQEAPEVDLSGRLIRSQERAGDATAAVPLRPRRSVGSGGTLSFVPAIGWQRCALLVVTVARVKARATAIRLA